ncbi:MAG: dockerin type I repeat-containing protein [Ruminococcus sp.]|nr:dockerin type I repeat-containing protein [Ruminococcus sp.]
MKKLLSLLLIIAVIASAFAVFSVNASAASGGTLKITSRKDLLGEVPVGSEFIFKVALDSGGYSIKAGQGTVYYDANYVQLVEYGNVRSGGKIDMDAYTFPSRIRNSSMICNYFGINNEIDYNFAKLNNIGVFSEEDPYFKVRFKAIASGTVDIRHFTNIIYSTDNNKDLKLIYNNVPNNQLDPIPFTVSTVEPAAGYVGDADGDCDLTVLDATFIQRLTAGVNSDYNLINADVNNDSEVNLRDALDILRYKAGIATDTKIGEWIFASEQEAVS